MRAESVGCKILRVKSRILVAACALPFVGMNCPLVVANQDKSQFAPLLLKYLDKADGNFQKLAENVYDDTDLDNASKILEKLEKDLAAVTTVTTLSCDVRDHQAVKAALQSLPEKWHKIDVLINNAGNAHGLDPIHLGSVADWDAMMDINVKGLLYVSREVIPGMTEQKSGHIIKYTFDENSGCGGSALGFKR